MKLQFRASPTNRINPFENKRLLGDFWCHNTYLLTHKDHPSYKNITIGFGIRRSNINWLMPVIIEWGKDEKGVSFNFWKLYFEITKNSCAPTSFLARGIKAFCGLRQNVSIKPQ